MDTRIAFVRYVVVPSTGRLHIRYVVDERSVDDGRCGADDNWVEIESVPTDVNPALLCRYCWPTPKEDR